MSRPTRPGPVLVFFNGLGGHRMIAALTEAIARAHNVQMLTLDKPGAGASSLSVHIPIAARTRWMHTALLAVLAHEHIPRFAVLSHSNDLFHALYTLLHLPPMLTATSWTLTGPFVPQSISGSPALRIAAALPAPLPNALGSLLQLVPPLTRAASRSGGLLSSSAGMLSAPVGPPARKARKPPHKCTAMSTRRVARRSCASHAWRWGRRRSLRCTEARLWTAVRAIACGASAAARRTRTSCGARSRPRGAPPRRCAAAARRLRRRGRAGPGAGRMWLKGVLETAGLLHGADAWKEVPDAGHDDVLFLEEVVGEIFGRVE
ncbi:hypothetical protein C8F04DRAFT_1257907 [Mycena alexandri]|uniref:Uncharacterized protein n=1 Tax=Mycena alexandri TaxID=1745969 RepID=A0AAD6SZ57_9AGAR|nr:hypothetical protein C8F04DRAFT_1257907 [Mycena alexandri]